VDRGRRIVVHYAIASGSTGACDLHHGPEPVRAIHSSASVTVPVTVAAAATHDLLYLTGPGSVRAFFTSASGRKSTASLSPHPSFPRGARRGQRPVHTAAGSACDGE
jgi:hypothetical protein